MNAVETASTLVCRPARSREELCAAFRLLYKRYLAASLTDISPIGMRIAPQQLWPECTIIVAVRRSIVVGTVSLVEDSPSRLPLDNVFGRVLTGFRDDNHRLLEIGCLAIDADGESPALSIFGALTRATVHFARAKKFDRLIAAVHPRHSRFYERSMGFQRVSDAIPFATVEGNMAVCVTGQSNCPQQFNQPWRDMFFGPIESSMWRATPRSSQDNAYFAHLSMIAGGGRTSGHLRAA